MLLNLTVTGGAETMAKIDRVSPAVLQGIGRELQAIVLELEAYIKGVKLSGGVLNVVRGNLRRSIHQALVEDSMARIARKLFSDGSVKYAAIHEYGGTIHHPGGTAYFIGDDGGAVFVSNSDPRSDSLPRTKPHDIVMPERSFMRSSLSDKRDEISKRLQSAAVKAAVSAYRNAA